MTAAEKLMTAEELARTSVPGKVLELIRGHLVVPEPSGTRHGVSRRIWRMSWPHSFGRKGWAKSSPRIPA